MHTREEKDKKDKGQKGQKGHFIWSQSNFLRFDQSPILGLCFHHQRYFIIFVLTTVNYVNGNYRLDLPF